MAEFVYTRALVLGASEVSRLACLLDQSVLTADRHDPGQDLKLTDSGFKFQRGFGIIEADIRVYGIGGRTVTKTWQHDLWIVDQFRPEVVIFHLGGNDLSTLTLTDAEAPQAVGQNLLLLCDHLVSKYRVSKVLISALTPRYPPYCGRIYPVNYNDRVAAVNQYLRTHVLSRPAVFLWDHKVSWWHYLVDPDDGVHFNPAGNKRWYKSLKGALLSALRGRI